MTAVHLEILLLSTVGQPQRLDEAHAVGRKLRVELVIYVGSDGTGQALGGDGGGSGASLS